MSQPHAVSVLIVDDDTRFATRLGRALTERGYEVRLAHDVPSAVVLAESDAPELAIVDLRMPGATGLELLQRLHELEPATRVVMLTGYGSIATAVDAMRLGAVNYVQKPATVDQILAAFERADQPVLQPDNDYEAPSLARVEWEHIERVLSDCGQNISEAARRLGLHRRSLQRKMSKFAPRG